MNDHEKNKELKEKLISAGIKFGELSEEELSHVVGGTGEEVNCKCPNCGAKLRAGRSGWFGLYMDFYYCDGESRAYSTDLEYLSWLVRVPGTDCWNVIC